MSALSLLEVGLQKQLAYVLIGEIVLLMLLVLVFVSLLSFRLLRNEQPAFSFLSDTTAVDPGPAKKEATEVSSTAPVSNVPSPSQPPETVRPVPAENPPAETRMNSAAEDFKALEEKVMFLERKLIEADLVRKEFEIVKAENAALREDKVAPVEEPKPTVARTFPPSSSTPSSEVVAEGAPPSSPEPAAQPASSLEGLLAELDTLEPTRSTSQAS